MDEDQGFWHTGIVAYRPTVRITHISDCFAPRTGGIETQVAGLVAQQRAHGGEVSVITATPGVGEDAIRVSARIPFDLPLHPRTFRAVTEQLRQLRPDVVHVHVGAVSPFAWESVRAARGMGLPTVVTVHSMWGPISRRGYAIGALVNQWPTWGVRMCAVSEQAARAVAHVTKSDVGLTPNGIDPALWQLTVAPDPTSPLHLVSVLRIAPRKRVLALIAMFAQVRKIRPDAHLTIIGDGPLLRLARSRAGSAPITFTGRLDRPAMLQVFAQAQMFWQPSIHESFGIAALEARCAGLPVLARSQSGTGTFITNEINGWLVGSDDAAVAHIVSLSARQVQSVRETNMHTEPPVTWKRVLPMVTEQYRLAQ